MKIDRARYKNLLNWILVVSLLPLALIGCGGGGTQSATPVAPVGDFSPATNYSNSYCTDGIYPTAWEWRADTVLAAPQPATSGTPLIKHIRNGQVIATYSQLSGYRSDPNNVDAHDTTVGPFRRMPYAQFADGDIFEVYPAVYEGEYQQIYIGPNFVNDTAYNAGTAVTPKNLIIRGVTVNGVRPVIRNPSTGASNNNLGQALVYVDASENITIENIDISNTPTGGGLGKAAVYINGANNMTLRNVRVSGFSSVSSNGVFGTSNNAGTLLLENVELADNGGSGGPEHNAYINASAVDNNFTFHVVGSWSHDSFYGHELKSRAQVTIVESSYLQGKRASPGTQTETYLLDVPEGGTLIARNNIFVKNHSGDNSNGASITFGVERNSTNFDLTRPWNLLLEHNTFVAFSKYYDSASHPLFPFFINATTPGAKAVQHNAFVGYCTTGNAGLDYRGVNYALLNFNEIDQAFRPRTALANGNPAIAGTMQYAHRTANSARTSIQIGARD